MPAPVYNRQTISNYSQAKTFIFDNLSLLQLSLLSNHISDSGYGVYGVSKYYCGEYLKVSVADNGSSFTVAIGLYYHYNIQSDSGTCYIQKSVEYDYGSEYVFAGAVAPYAYPDFYFVIADSLNSSFIGVASIRYQVELSKTIVGSVSQGGTTLYLNNVYGVYPGSYWCVSTNKAGGQYRCVVKVLGVNTENRTITTNEVPMYIPSGSYLLKYTSYNCIFHNGIFSITSQYPNNDYALQLPINSSWLTELYPILLGTEASHVDVTIMNQLLITYFNTGIPLGIVAPTYIYVSPTASISSIRQLEHDSLLALSEIGTDVVSSISGNVVTITNNTFDEGELIGAYLISNETKYCRVITYNNGKDIEVDGTFIVGQNGTITIAYDVYYVCACDEALGDGYLLFSISE